MTYSAGSVMQTYFALLHDNNVNEANTITNIFFILTILRKNKDYLLFVKNKYLCP